MSSVSDEQLELAKILTELRREIGDGEFGFRSQALFAHTLPRLGGTIRTINAQGHPDIVANIGGTEIVFEVEITHSAKRKHVLKCEDPEAIKPIVQSSTGYLAVLDCALPAKWVLLNFRRFRRLNLGCG